MRKELEADRGEDREEAYRMEMEGREMDLAITLGLVAIVVAGAVAAVQLKNLLRAAVALGASSLGLAALFFFWNAPYAGAFELSVGAGLMSVLFIIATSVTDSAVDEIN